MDLEKLQEEVNTRWDKQIDNPCHRSAGPNHALVHMTKALGKIASALNDAEHEGGPLDVKVEKYLADLVICAARFSHGANVDLNVACLNRLAEKFSVWPDQSKCIGDVHGRGFCSCVFPA